MPRDNSINRLGRILTLGVAMNRIGEPYENGLLLGVLEAVRAAGVNLLCFVGGEIPTDQSSMGRHKILELIGPHNVDGLVVFSSTLMHRIDRREMTDYCNCHFPALPLCSVGAHLQAIPSITTSNEEGMQHVVAHLIREHGAKRIAFVRGPEANEEAECRFRAYVQTLAEHGLEFDARLVWIGDFSPSSGLAAVRQFSRIRGISLTDLDAIVASNDLMALGILRGLEEAGVSVPAQVAVTGFDDGAEAALTTPPLTTVRQPLAKIGRHAARIMIERIQTKVESSDAMIPTEVVVRRSCGCSDQSTRTPHSIHPTLNCSFDAALIMRRQHILAKLTRAARGELGVAGADWQARLLNSLTCDLSAEQANNLLELMESIAEKLVARGGDVQPCYDVLDCLRRQLGTALNGEQQLRNRAEEVFYRTQLALSQIMQREMARAQLRLGRSARDISSTCNSLSSVVELRELRAIINEQLPYLGLNEYFVVLYDDADPQRAQLLASHAMDGETAPMPDARFDPEALLPRGVLTRIGSGKAFVLLPLAHRSHVMGHALFGLDLDRTLAYEQIANAIAAGIRSAKLGEAAQTRARDSAVILSDGPNDDGAEDHDLTATAP